MVCILIIVGHVKFIERLFIVLNVVDMYIDMI